MSRIRVVFDLLAQRWEIARAEIELVSMPQPRSDNVYVGFGPDGTVIEIIVDALRLPALAIDEIATAFGDDAATAIAALEPTGDLDVVIETTTSDIRSVMVAGTTSPAPADTATNTTPAAPTEPGIPIARPDGTFEVPGAIDTRGRRSIDTVTLRVDDGALGIELPRLSDGDELWIRVSAAQSGTLLAIGPTRPASPVTHLPFGLDIPPEHLHIRIDTDPLTPVGNRHQRRTMWVDQLLERAENRTWTRPGPSGRDAATARAVADELGDRARSDRAAALGRRATTSRWIRRAVIAAVLIGIGGIAWALVSGVSDPNAGPRPEIPTSTTEPYIETRSAAIGPATFTYGDAGSVRAIVQGSTADVGPGDTVSVRISAITQTIWDYSGFDPELSLEENELIARTTCLQAVQAPVGPYTAPPIQMTLRLAKLGPDQTPADIIAGDLPVAGMYLTSAPMSIEMESSTSIAESCEAARLDVNGRFYADTLATRTPQTVDVTIPDSTPPGIWMLVIDAPDTPAGMGGSIVLRID